ncbi:MAG TPA: peptidoglycan-associated lipoprotein Pal, partial [Candidatus Eisenbacteria bacterium]
IAAVALVATGCSKKTTPPDVTQTTPAPDAGNNGGNNDANATPVDKVPGDDADNANLKDIYFDYDDHTLSADARSTLSGNASYLREMGAIRVNIEGHCDERGTVEYNLALGQRRADATRSYLVDLGIESSRLSTISYGEERPFEMGHDESAWHQNRRAHFRVVNP